MKTPKKEIKDRRCKGRQPGTSKPCQEIIFQTDGEFLYVGGYIVNSEYATQNVTCKCGAKNVWRCDPEFLPEKTRGRWQ